MFQNSCQGRCAQSTTAVFHCSFLVIFQRSHVIPFRLAYSTKDPGDEFSDMFTPPGVSRSSDELGQLGNKALLGIKLVIRLW